MKDFDEVRAEREQRDRTFKIGGREFRFRPAIPAETYSLYLELMDQMSAGHWPAGSFDTLNATVTAILDPEYRDEWEQVIGDRSAHPVSFEDISDVIEYCVGVNAGRPPTQRERSPNTGESASTRSTENSGLQAVPAGPASTSAVG